jgi:glycosyltransferase involved in cell wall biosynthesis
LTDKIKLLTISDHPLVASGVAIQTRYILEGLLKTGDYQIRSLGGAMRHTDYRPVRLEQYQDDWLILPIDGYGTQQIVRDVLDSEKFDALWFMTDPRFYLWLFEMMDEVSARGLSVLYNHVWDEFPVPEYNRPYYAACDYIGCISKLTHEILCKLGMPHKAEYIPHAVDHNIFKPANWSPSERYAAKAKYLGAENATKFVVYYNSRNARRKMTADIIAGFKGLLDAVGEDKAFLFMHTDPFDQEGTNLIAVANMLGLKPNSYSFSSKGQPPEIIADYNNISDVLVNISNNEGFGLSCLEALSCGTLAIVNLTGGLSDQIMDANGTEFGIALKPAVRSIQGSQHIPYIYDCRVAHEDLVAALIKIYNMPVEERHQLGKAAREWTLKAFSMDAMISKWDRAIKFYVEKNRTSGQQLQVASL